MAAARTRRPLRAAADNPEERIAALVDAHGAALLRVAHHFSLCADDAHDAYQRALEIYLRRLATVDPATEGAWMKVVVRHEAMAVRRGRAESVTGEDIDFDARADEDLRAMEDRLAATERSARSAEVLRQLKPDEATALLHKAEGMTYDEIGRRYGWTYTNVTATLALFVALGGTSYAALKLPRDSVGDRQLRSKSVGASELRRSAVRGRHLGDRTVSLSKLSRSARSSLRGASGPGGPPGPPGPSGVTLRASVDPIGGVVRPRDGSVGSTSGSAFNETVISFGRSISGCTPTATLARVEGSDMVKEPPPGRVTVGDASDNAVIVKTFNTNGEPEEIGFSLLVAC